ncbi:Sulfite exporter TauE/SafE [compost metagenome]
MPLELAVPLSVLMSILVALIVIIQDHEHVHFNSAKWLIIFAIIGIPLGLMILIYGNEFYVKIGLGLLIIFYSVYSLFWKSGLTLKADHKYWLFVCGFLSGVLGGAYGLNGPPLVVYGNMRNWSAKHFRATLQAYFLPASFITSIGYFAKGLVTMELLKYFLVSVPAIFPAVFLGRYINHKIRGNSFFKYVYIGLIVIGAFLIINSVINLH